MPDEVILETTCYSLDAARDFFLKNSTGKCYVSKEVKDRIEKQVVESFQEAEAFFNEGKSESATAAEQLVSDIEVKGDPFRMEYKTLSEEEMLAISLIKTVAQELWQHYESAMTKLGADPRSISTAKTHLETSVMWATKGITTPKQ